MASNTSRLFFDKPKLERILAIVLVVLAALGAGASGLVYPSNYSPLLFLGGVIGVILVISWFLKPTGALCLAIFIVLLPAGSIPDTTQSLLNRTMTILAFATWAFDAIVHRRRIFWAGSALIMFAFIVWGMSTVLWAENTGYATTKLQVYAFRFLLFLFLIPNEIKTEKDLAVLFIFLALDGWVFLWFSVSTLLQQGYIPGSRFQVLNVNANDAGLLAMTTMIGVIWTASRPGRKQTKFLKALAYIYFLFTLGTVLMSGSRGSSISLGIVLGSFGLWRTTRNWTQFGFLLLLVGLLAVPSVFVTTIERFTGTTGDDSATALGGREVLWEAAGKVITAHPALGVGLGNSSHAMTAYLDIGGWDVGKDGASMHNPTLVIWSETGLFGLIIYLSIPISAVFIFIKQYFRYRELNIHGYFEIYFALISAVFMGFMSSWFKGGAMEVSYTYFLMIALLIIPAGLDVESIQKSALSASQPVGQALRQSIQPSHRTN